LLNTSHNGATTASSDFQGKHYLELLDVVFAFISSLWDKDFVTVLLLVGLIPITVKLTYFFHFLFLLSSSTCFFFLMLSS